MPLASAPPHVALAGWPLPDTLAGCGVVHVLPLSELRVSHCAQPPQWPPDFSKTNSTSPVAGSTTGAPPNSVRLVGSTRIGIASSHVLPSSWLRRR